MPEVKPTPITREEVADVLRAAVRGEFAVTLVNQSLPWDDVYCGPVEFWFRGWAITFFNDCGELDYVEHVIAPDGRSAVYDDLSDDLVGPVDLLTDKEFGRLEGILEAAK